MAKKHKKMGRPTNYKPECIQQVELLAMLGLTEQEIGIYLNVAQSTITLWKEKHPEFLKALIKGRINAEISLTKAMFESAKKGNVLAGSFLLCNWFPEKYKHTQRIEHTAKDVKAIEFKPAEEFKKEDGKE